MTENPLRWELEQVSGDTSDWVYVTHAGDHGYDWETIGVFYSPRARKYFWLADQGCSCTYWADGRSVSDFHFGGKPEARVALRAFVLDSYEDFSSSVDRALTELREFRP